MKCGMCHSFVEGPMPLWDVSAVATMNKLSNINVHSEGSLEMEYFIGH